MRILHLAIAIFAFLCCGNVRHPQLPTKKVLIINTSELSGQQKAIVKEATDSWARQTRGCVQIIEGEGTKIMRMTPPEKYDEENKWVLGMCLPDIGNCKTIEMSFSRMRDRDQAIIVAAHELGHALGMHHNQGKHSLMHPDAYQAWLGLSMDDLRELKQVTGCDLLPVIEIE